MIEAEAAPAPFVALQSTGVASASLVQSPSRCPLWDG